MNEDDTGSMSEQSIAFVQWPHAPSHLFIPKAAYFSTTGTYYKRHFFDTPTALDFVLGVLFEESAQRNWRLEAWAVMANHYHLVMHAPDDAKTLSSLLNALHSKTAIWINKRDNTPGRKVWGPSPNKMIQ